MFTWSLTYQQSVFKPYHSNKDFSAGIDMKQNYVTVTLCIRVVRCNLRGGKMPGEKCPVSLAMYPARCLPHPRRASYSFSSISNNTAPLAWVACFNIRWLAAPAWSIFLADMLSIRWQTAAVYNKLRRLAACMKWAPHNWTAELAISVMVAVVTWCVYSIIDQPSTSSAFSLQKSARSLSISQSIKLLSQAARPIKHAHTKEEKHTHTHTHTPTTNY